MTMRKTIILTIACMCLAVGANAQRGSGRLSLGAGLLYIRRSQQSCRQKKCRYDSFFVHVIDLLILFFFPYLFFLLCFVPAFQFLLNPPFGNLAVHLFDFKSDVVSSRADSGHGGCA